VQGDSAHHAMPGTFAVEEARDLGKDAGEVHSSRYHAHGVAAPRVNRP
jgi:hypothetical protein